jgi:hypothetical protein
MVSRTTEPSRVPAVHLSSIPRALSPSRHHHGTPTLRSDVLATRGSLPRLPQALALSSVRFGFAQASWDRAEHGPPLV